MRKLVKTLSLVLSLSLLFGLVACQTKDKAPAEQNGKKISLYNLLSRIRLNQTHCRRQNECENADQKQRRTAQL